MYSNIKMNVRQMAKTHSVDEIHLPAKRICIIAYLLYVYLSVPARFTL